MKNLISIKVREEYLRFSTLHLRAKNSHNNKNLELKDRYLQKNNLSLSLTLQKVIAVQDLEPLVTPCHISEWILHVRLTLYLELYEGNFLLSMPLCVFLLKYFYFRPKKLVKWNESISRNFFLGRARVFSIFWNFYGKYSRKISWNIFIWFHEFFDLTFFYSKNNDLFFLAFRYRLKT